MSSNRSEQTCDLHWRDARFLTVGGRGWTDVKRFFSRLPAQAETVVLPEVWALSQQTAGIYVGFTTDAGAISARWTLLNEKLDGYVMSAIGASGLDLYVQDGNKWRWLAVGIPKSKNAHADIVRNLPPGKRNYLLYLPLRNGVESLEIGVDTQTVPMAFTPFSGRPIVYYGTSIVHGEGASRPGMCHASILSRRLNREVINLGFAGSGAMDVEIARLMGEIEAAFYIIDCLPNMTAPMIEERAVKFVNTLRGARTDTPIVLVEDRTYANAWLAGNLYERHQTSRQALRASYNSLIESGFLRLHYVEGEQLLGGDNEATVDGSHPSDMGYTHYANVLEPVFRELLRV